jgi:hypothetical protein
MTFSTISLCVPKIESVQEIKEIENEIMMIEKKISKNLKVII